MEILTSISAYQHRYIHGAAIFSLSSTGPEQASYSEFLKAVSDKQVAEANIGESKIQWTRKDNGKSFLTTRIPGVDNSPIIEQLQADGADFPAAYPAHCGLRC